MGVDLEALEEALRRAFLEAFGEDLVSLVLFGSYARGDYGRDSDIDLLVVLERVGDRLEVHRKLDLVEERLEPSFRVMRERGYNPRLSPIVLSRDQAMRTRPLYLDMVFDCRILYDRGGFIEGILGRVRRKLEEYGAERVYIGRKYVLVLKKEYKFGDVIEI